MNVCTLSGNIGRDAELRHTASGDAVAGWSLAVSTGSRDKPETMWVDCVIYGKRAESLAQYMVKGTKIVASGRLTQRSYTTKAGEARTGLQLSVDQVEFASRRESSERPVDRPAAAPREKSSDPFDGFQDDIPF